MTSPASPPRPPTLEDVAKRTGVSKDTVARVLRGDFAYSRPAYAKRAERVRQEAERMGYRPNTAARAMREGKFSTLAIALPAQSVGKGLVFPPDLMGKLADGAARENLNLVIADFWLDRIEHDSDYVPKVLRDLSVDAVLVMWTRRMSDAAQQRIIESDLPVIWINDRRSYDAVYPDEERGGYEGTRRFIEQGHTHIGYCSFAEDIHYSVRDRRDGYIRAMEEAGLPLIELPRTIQRANRPQPRVDQLCKWLDQSDRPTAVMSYGSQESLSLVRAAGKLRLAIPEDLSMIYFGAMNTATQSAELDIIKLSWRDIGTRAIGMATQKLQAGSSKRQPGEAIVSELVGFGSTAPRPGTN